MHYRDYLQQLIYKIINPVVKGLIKMGVTPNVITTTGLVLNIVAAALFIYAGYLAREESFFYVGLGGGVVLFAGLFDMLDGVFVTRAPAHPHFLLPDEASAFARLMRMNTHNMSLFRFSRDERRAVLQHIIDYYRLHQPDLPEIRSLEVMQQLFD